MKKIQDERGYTLVVVLLVIVLFLGVSSMFIKASISHAKQEKIIDSSNTAVAAAEMGVEYYSTFLEFETKAIVAQFNVDVADSILKLQEKAAKIINQVTTKKTIDNSLINPECTGIINTDNTNKLQDWINCENDVIKNKYKNKFIDEMNLIISAISADIPKPVNKFTGYRIQTIEKVESIDEESIDEITFDLEVLGKDATSTKLLNAKLTTKIPSFISGDKTIPIKTNLTDKEVTTLILSPPVANPPPCPENPSYFSGGTCNYTGNNLADYMKKLPNPKGTSLKVDDYCKAMGSGNCNFNNIEGNESTPIYLSGDINGGNANQLTKLNIYSNGKFTVQNLNSATNNIIVTRSLELHGGDLKNSLIAVLGYDKSDDKLGTIKWSENGNKNVTIGENSKLCINLNGIDLNKSTSFIDNTLQTSGSGKIIFYPSRINKTQLPEEGSILTDNTLNKTVQYISDYLLFLETCSVNLNNLPGDFTLNGSIESDADIEVEVDYKN